MVKPRRLSELNVLSLDDDPFQLDIITASLNHIGIDQVTVELSAGKALEIVKQAGSEIDVILCDLHMPGMDGIEFMLKLAGNGFEGCLAVISGADTTIIGLAESLAPSLGIRLLGTLKKPITAKQLQELLETALQ